MNRVLEKLLYGAAAGLLSLSLVPALALADEQVAEVPVEAQAAVYNNMYRLYNRYSGEHFYTASLDEATSLAKVGWTMEGVGWVAPSISSEPVYRVYNPYTSDHHYTLSAGERNDLVALGWSDEGIGWYSESDTSGNVLLRQFNPYATIGTHNYTLSAEERDALIPLGWVDEGTAWVASTRPAESITPFWYVSEAGRCFVTSSAAVAQDRVIRPEEGAGVTAFATSSGAIVRNGAYATGDRVYLADDNGNLVNGSGWLVTSAYAPQEERYWLDQADGYATARPGFFTIDGCNYYADPATGAIARNCNVTIDGQQYSADNNGVLTAVVTPEGLENMFARLGDLNSETDYGIFVDLGNHKVGIFKGGTGSWQFDRAFDCTVGAPWSPTVTGSFTVSDKGYSFGEGYTAYYYTRFYNDYLFHSILFEEGTFDVQDGRIGVDASHGCVRLPLEDAKWIYNNIPYGTRVIVF